MNHKALTAWLSELRNPEHKQAKFQLKSKDGCYCAMGLLVLAYEKESGRKVFVEDDLSCVVPQDDEKVIMDWAGLPKFTRLIYGPFFFHEKFDYCVPVSSLSDLGISFEEIANFLESRYGVLV